jgi:sigma-54 specific flagellar transcriptional regulator A
MTVSWKPDAVAGEPLESIVIGESPAISRVRDLIRQVAHSDASVMITGPSGSGKEIVATAIHHESRRAKNRFVAVNCGAIPRDLLESELFGHEKGSFTGAIAQRRGRFEDAHKGTLFLDEIGDMPADMQVKLLRVLEARQIERVGGSGAIDIDARIISATHQNLEERIDRGQFREDLFYRLAVFPIQLPALNERPEDIAPLIDYFVRRLCAPDTVLDFSEGAMARLLAHEWRGNVRELRNVVERAIILFPNMRISADQVDTLFRRRNSNPGGGGSRAGQCGTPSARYRRCGFRPEAASGGNRTPIYRRRSGEGRGRHRGRRPSAVHAAHDIHREDEAAGCPEGRTADGLG